MSERVSVTYLKEMNALYVHFLSPDPSLYCYIPIEFIILSSDVVLNGEYWRFFIIPLDIWLFILSLIYLASLYLEVVFLNAIHELSYFGDLFVLCIFYEHKVQYEC